MAVFNISNKLFNEDLMAETSVIQNNLFKEKDLLSITEASIWASKFLNKKVSNSNISYLIQYGKVKKYGFNSTTLISKKDLINYYNSFNGRREINWKKQLGDDLNWSLSFDHLREKDTTKHVHRLHPYKGKFIPQLVEYFIDDHIDKFKKKTFFQKGDIILDPFCGSGTALVQANELGMHAIGIDISRFNSLISNVKIAKYDLIKINSTIKKITKALDNYLKDSNIPHFEQELLEELYEFNNNYFPSPDFRYKVSRSQINEFQYAGKKEKEFLPIYESLIEKFKVKLKQDNKNSFLDIWYIQNARNEIDFVFNLIKNIKDPSIKRIISIILSRAIRSCRATTHSDLATLKEPQITSYYCVKHKKICKPLFSIRNKWVTYSKDTLRRLDIFNNLRTNTYQFCLTGDSRTIDIFDELEKKNDTFGKLAKKQKISGIFSSPPYVGLIDYHEQHSYAYDLFGFERQDGLEIGPLSKGGGKEARDSYVDGISRVLINCRKYLTPNFNILIVANDKHNLYPSIAGKAGMTIVNQYKRPVLNRTERDKAAYSEIIFHLRAV